MSKVSVLVLQDCLNVFKDRVILENALSSSNPTSIKLFSTTRRSSSGLKMSKMKSMGPIWRYGFEISLIGVGFERERAFSGVLALLNTIKQFRKTKLKLYSPDF